MKTMSETNTTTTDELLAATHRYHAMAERDERRALPAVAWFRIGARMLVASRRHRATGDLAVAVSDRVRDAVHRGEHARLVSQLAERAERALAR